MSLQTGSSETRALIWKAAERFERWLDATGYASYDPYDVWGTRYSLFARKLYYQKGLPGLPFIAPILLMDIAFPGLRALFVKKERFATADGQLALAFLNLYEHTGQKSYLQKAIGLCEDLIQSSVPGFSGLCWGYPFDWQNDRGLWRKNTPYITTGPYCFEAFLRLSNLGKCPKYADAAASVARFVFADLHDTPVSAEAAAGSYSTIDRSKVVNASAYRAWVLFEAASRFGEPGYADKAWGNLNFILQSQRADGAWLYAVDSPGEAFIDHFHTCFVLKNLWKINRILGDSRVRKAIELGFRYYRRELFDSQRNPKSFSVEPRTQLVSLEMYNFAEAITLGVLLRQDIPEAFDLAKELAQRLATQYQVPDGHFVTRVYRGGLRHTFPFLRWPQAQLFYALTTMLLAQAGDTEDGSPAAGG